MENSIGTVQQADIDQQMRSAYIDYAMSVIVARALPDARDGLKPVHRRILYSMHDMGMRSNSPYKKSARIVGEVLGKYHPHGDSAVYDAMARMAQDFSMRYMLVDGQGNFGSIDGDSPAAMRYTEARLNAITEELLIDIDKETVDFVDNFDSTLQEPSVLPASLPNLLLNGSSGIAVGMATNIPPHNLREVCAALVYLIDNYEGMDDVSVEELMEIIPGPDFPTGGIIVGKDGIRQAYATGRGRLVVRGKAVIEEGKGNRQQIIITEIPYMVNKSGLVERIAELVREGRMESISDLRDESNRNGMRIVIELKRNAQAQRVLNQLYKYTPFQSTFSAQLLALVGDEPKLLTLKRCLKIFIEHRQEVVTRRSQFELDRARKRVHILDGLLIALANLDEVIKTIRQSDDAEIAKTRLMDRFKLTEIQAQAILDMQLRRLAALERQKIEDEHRQVLETIAYLEDLLKSPSKVLEVIKNDLLQLSEKYGDDRRTDIEPEAREELSEEDLVRDERVLISITKRGYIKRVPTRTYKTQGRGQVGVTGQAVNEEDEVLLYLTARTLHTVLFFSDCGKVYSNKVYHIPEGGRTDRGLSIANVLAVDGDERITAAVVVSDFKEAKYCVLATARGKLKRMRLSDFQSVRPSGLIALKLVEGDTLGWVGLSSGYDDILLVTAKGRALRMSEKQIRIMGRQAAGVRGIRLVEGDQVISMEIVKPGGSLLVVTENGYGKRTALDQYHKINRGGRGVATLNLKSMKQTGDISAARVVQDTDEISLISSVGTVLRFKAKDIRLYGRVTKGVRLMNLSRGGIVATIARIPMEELKKDEDAEP